MSLKDDLDKLTNVALETNILKMEIWREQGVTLTRTAVIWLRAMKIERNNRIAEGSWLDSELDSDGRVLK